MPIDFEVLFKLAETARAHAYAPYSKFLVGAAIRTEDGMTYSGCNVENASYPLSVCAERNAIAAMVNSGARKVTHVAIVVDADAPVPPCGACRQVLAEFCEENAIVATRTLKKVELKLALKDLLPHAFSGKFLKS